MRRHLPLITVVACQVLLAGLAAILYFVTRPAFAEAYRDFPGPIPGHAILALSSWYLPSLVAVAMACDAVALAVRRPTVRNAALGVGLVVPTAGLIVAIDGIFVPLFRAAPAP